MKSKKISTRVLALALAVVMVIGVGSFAYFSDSVVTSSQGTSGTVAINLTSDINLLNDEGLDILNPGDMRDGSFEVENMGNKSIDVRTTIALTALDHEDKPINFTGDATTQSEFDLYLREDVEYVEGKGYMPKEGAKPIEVKSIEGNVITYVLPEYSLNGNMDLMEFESVEGVLTDSHDYDFVLVFKSETGNKWQDATLNLDLIVEAKQHENTQAGWDVVAQETVTHGSLNQSVVNGENILTDGGIGGDNGSNNGTAWFRVTDEEYFTFQEAIDAVEDGGTIEILGDAASSSSNIYVITENVNAGGKGFTIIAPTNGDGVSTPIEIHNAGTMTGFENVRYTDVTVKEDGYGIYGYGDYYDLQIACDAAESGDIIYVMADCVVANNVTSDKELTLMPLNKDVTITIDSTVDIAGLNLVGNNGKEITMQLTNNGLLKSSGSAARKIVVGNGASLVGTGSNDALMHPEANFTLTVKDGGTIGETKLVYFKNTLSQGNVVIEAGATVRNVTTLINNSGMRCSVNISDGAILENVTTIKG